MEGIKAVPSRIYYFVAAIIEMLILFVFSMVKLNKPSDTLNNNDINNLRRYRKPDGNGNDMNYKGSRSSQRVYMGG